MAHSGTEQTVFPRSRYRAKRIGLFALATVCIFLAIAIMYNNFGWNTRSQEVAVQYVHPDEAVSEVLLIMSYDESEENTPHARDGFLDVMGRSKVAVDVVYMDAYNAPAGSDAYRTFVSQMGKKVSQHGQYAAVICADDEALFFVEENHDSMFPSTPVVFYGINDFNHALYAATTGYMTGAVEQTYFGSIMQAAANLHPEATTFLTIVDETPAGVGNRGQFNLAMQNFQGMTVRYVDASALTRNELASTVSNVGSDTIVFLLDANNDRDGNVYSLDQSVSFVTEAASVPVYRTSMGGVGNGIAGSGYLDAEADGKRAAETTIDVLNGKRPADIPLTIEGTLGYVFDAQVLDNYGISTVGLPTGSTVINRNLFSWDTLRLIVLPIALLIIAFFFLRAAHRTKPSPVAMAPVGAQQINAQVADVDDAGKSRAGKNRQLAAKSSAAVAERPPTSASDGTSGSSGGSSDDLQDDSSQAANLAGKGKAGKNPRIGKGKRKKRSGKAWRVTTDDLPETPVTEDAHSENDEAADIVIDEQVAVDASNSPSEGIVDAEASDIEVEMSDAVEAADETHTEVDVVIEDTVDDGDSDVDETDTEDIEVEVETAIEEAPEEPQEAKTSAASSRDRSQESQKHRAPLGGKRTLRKRHVEPQALIGIEIINYSDIEDMYGTNVAEESLRVIRKRLDGVENEIFINQEGSGFLVGLDSELSRGAQQIEFVEFLLRQPLTIEGNSITLHTCVVVVSRQNNMSVEEMEQSIAFAIEQSKELGYFDTVVYYDSNMRRAMEDRVEISKLLEQSIRLEDFLVFYQPQVDLHDNDVSGYEALVRLKDKKYPPSQFIPVAEMTGVIVDIDRIVTKRAVEQLSKWKRRNKRLRPISINLSALHLKRDDDYVDFLMETMQKYEVPANYIRIEITEALFAADQKKAEDLITRLFQSGITIALDRFGMGFTSFSDIMSIPASIVKIDKEFVDTFLVDGNDANFEQLVLLAQGFGKRVVVVGVDKKWQLDVCRNLNCDAVQGYYFSKPLLPENAVQYKPR